MTLIEICKSFKEGKCKDRLEFYVLKSMDGESAIIQLLPCPYFENGHCSSEGSLIDLYGIPQRLTLYIEKGSGLEKVSDRKTLDHDVLKL